MPRDLGWSRTNIYGSPVGWIENTECQCNLSAIYIKGQIKPKADWRAVDSHKNQRTNLFCWLFCFSQQTKQIRSLKLKLL
jgi:hypothetical protein